MSKGGLEDGRAEDKRLFFYGVGSMVSDFIDTMQ